MISTQNDNRRRRQIDRKRVDKSKESLRATLRAIVSFPSRNLIRARNLRMIER